MSDDARTPELARRDARLRHLEAGLKVIADGESAEHRKRFNVSTRVAAIEAFAQSTLDEAPSVKPPKRVDQDRSDKPVRAPKDADGWRNYADPSCENCHGEGIITGMGGQSKVISACRFCWPDGEPQWDFTE